jgi:dTMP kinase
MVKGKFITFEGIDGAGKSTHVETISTYLRAKGKTVVTTRFQKHNTPQTI